MGDGPLLHSLSNEEVVVSSSSSGAGTLIDVAAGKGIVAAMDAMRTGSIFDRKGLSLIALGWCILISTVVMVAIGGANILVAKLVLGILVALGPIFIASLLFESTRRFFERWLAMVVTYALVLALFASFFTFLLSIFGHYVAQVKFDGTQNPGYATAGAAILATVSVVTLLEMKVLAMGLGGASRPRAGEPGTGGSPRSHAGSKVRVGEARGRRRPREALSREVARRLPRDSRLCIGAGRQGAR